MADLFNGLLENYAALNRRSRPKLKHLAEWFDVTVKDGTYAGGWKATDVDSSELERYVASRRKDGAADATIHNELAALRRAFNRALEVGRLTTVPKFPMPKVSNVRECYFTVEQLDRLLAFLPAELRAPVRFAALTGWRAQNVFGLRWEHVDFGRRLVRTPIGQTKTGEPFRTPFAHDSELERLLREQEQSRRGPYVFHRNGERIKSYLGSWRAAVRKLGADGYGEQCGRKVLKRFHDLRHTMAQHMTDAGVPERVIMELGTWKTRSTFDRYRISSDEAKREAMAQVEQYMAAERQKATKVVDLKRAAAG